MSRTPRSHNLIVVLGILLALPSLGAGFFADDFWHVSVMSGDSRLALPSTTIDLFRFGSGDAAQVQEGIRRGFYPWWTDANFRAAFFRPLSALTHFLDYRLWGARPAGYHATNLLLWALVLLAAGALIRRLAPTQRAATLSFFIFAVADARAVVISWIANRNALIATALAFAALTAWDSYRRGKGRLRAALAWILFVLAMLAGETALGGLAILIGYEALGLPEGRKFDTRRLVSIAPLLAIILVYAAWYKLAGYGTSGSGMYIDPSTNPGDWLAAAAFRFPTLIAGLLWAWPIDFWVSGGATRTLIVAGALILLPISAFVFARTVRQHRSIAAAALGGALAVLPLTSTFPAARLLLLPGLAGALLVGAYLDDAWPLRSTGRLRAAIAVLLGLRHVVLAPLFLFATMFLLNGAFRQLRDEILDSPWPANLGSLDIVLLNAPHWASATYMSPCLALAGRPYPRKAHLLNLSPYPIRVTRTGPATLEMRLRCGEMLTTEFERVERSSPISAGATVDAGLFRATVLEAGLMGPRAVRFDFAGNLEGGPLLVIWAGSRYQPFAIPPIGSTLELPALSQGIGNLRAPAPACDEP